jgi:ferredoxin
MLLLEDVEEEGKICEASTQPRRVESGTSHASDILPRAIKARIDPTKSRSCGSCIAEVPLLDRALLGWISRGLEYIKEGGKS